MRLNRVSFFFSSVPNPNGIPRNRSRIFSRAADRLQWRRHLRWRQKKMRGSRRSITFFSVFFLERMEFFFKEKKGAHSSETRKFLYSRPAGMAVSIDWHGIGFGCGERVFQRVWRVVRVVGRGWAGVCVCCSCHDRWPVGWRGVLIFFVCVFIIYHHHLARLFTFAGWRVGVVPSIFFVFVFLPKSRPRPNKRFGFFFSLLLFRSKERKSERKRERTANKQQQRWLGRQVRPLS